MVKSAPVLLLVLGVSLFAQDAPPAPSTPISAPAAALPDVPRPGEEPIDKRIAGVLPNYRTANLTDNYTGISQKRKLIIACKDSFDFPLVYIGSVFALIGQASNADPSYGQGVQGFAKRLAAGYGDQMIGNMMTEGFFPMMLHEDPRYFRMGAARGKPGKRFVYAVTRIFVTHTDAGNLRFNYSEVLGNAAGVAVTESYHFDDRNASDAVQKLGIQLGTDAISQVLKEFWPDVKKRFMKHLKQSGS
jgi:hypothetical protein